MTTHKLIIHPDGRMRCIYTDAIRPLLDDAKVVATKRVSHVEPNAQGWWVADLSPVGGPTSPAFRLREEALQWEKAWVEEHIVAGIASVARSSGIGGSGSHSL